jgi:hypothetical protein
VTLIEHIIAFFWPCPHEWERIVELKDREENPTAATVVYGCKLCARTKQETFVAPKGHASCPPHKWRLVASTDVYDHADTELMKAGDVKREDCTPHSYLERFECSICGERKTDKVTG